MTMFIKIASLGAGLAGLGLLGQKWSHHHHELAVHESQMVANDYWHHTEKGWSDNSGYSTLTKIHHFLTNPANFHFITRPWIYVKGAFDFALENTIPLGLALVGLTWGFGGNLLHEKAAGGAITKRGVLSTVFDGIGWSLPKIGKGITETARAAWAVLPKNIPIPTITGPKEVLAVAAGLGMLAWIGHKFVNEVRGINHEEANNALTPPAH